MDRTPISSIPFPNSAFAHDRTLLTTQRNQVLQLIQDRGLDPHQFTWSTVPSSSYQRSDVGVSKLTHSPSGFYFVFNSTRDGELFFQSSPGTQLRVDERRCSGWGDQILNFSVWLGSLAFEISAIDQWEAIREERALMEAAAGQKENQPFTLEEQARIVQNVEEIKRLILSSTEANQQQIAFVNSQLSYLADASKRLGRKDWLIVAFSSIVTITVALSLSPEAGKSLLKSSGEVLYWLIQDRLLFPIY